MYILFVIIHHARLFKVINLNLHGHLAPDHCEYVLFILYIYLLEQTNTQITPAQEKQIQL
jgi:hypothetical protein